MRKSNWLTLAVAVTAILATVSQAQTNSCVSFTDGFWDEARLWSLEKPPSIRQSAILITNDASETITIDSTTATHFKSTLTISNLTVDAQDASTDTLYLDNTGTIALRILDSLVIGSSDGPPDEGSELISSNSTLIVDGLLGGQFQDNGTVVITGGSLITTNCSLQIAASFYSFYPTTVGLLILSNAVVRARDVIIAPSSPSSGAMEVIGGKMTLSSYLNVGDGDEYPSQGDLLVANGGLLVVTNDETDIGGFYESSGTMNVSNATFLAADVFLGGTRSSGELVINNGTVTLSGALGIGEDGEAAFGSVSLNGGELVVTNGTTTLGGEQNYGFLTVSDGVFLGQTVLVAPDYNAAGGLTIQGGVSILSSSLQVGSGLSDASVSITGGQLFVTNAPIVVSSGYGSLLAEFGVSGGQLAAKTIEVGSSAEGALTVDGGSVTVSEGITLGDCNNDFAIGYVTVSAGQLTVTNASHMGFIDVQNGQLVLSSGLLQVDKLVMTNSCSQFIHTGGTLIVGSVILDPNAFQITSVAREGNDLLVTWLMAPGATNALQVSSGGTNGGYIPNGFTDIFIVTNNTTTGTLTNYLDIGAATNILSRYYRARLAP
jgi:hypothetical protein